MTDTRSAPARPAPDAPTGPTGLGGEPAPEATVGDLFCRVYQFFYSKTVGLFLILATTVLVLIGVLVGQAPAGTYDDPAAREQFLAQAQDKYGGWSGVLDTVGLFRVFSSPMLLVVIALLSLSIVACTAHRVPVLWRRYRHPRIRVADRFFDRARYRADLVTPLSADRVTEVVRERLRVGRYRVLVDPDDPRSLYADRFAWGGIGTVAAHISFIMIIAAFVISGSTGIDDTLSVPVGGQPVEVGHGTGMTVAATSFEAAYDDSGRPLDYVSHLVLTDADGRTVEQDVRVNQPLRAGSVRFHQATFGVAADVELASADGTVVFAGSVPLLWTSTDGTASVGVVELPEHGVEIEVLTPASGVTGGELAAGQAAFRVFDAESSELVATGVAEQGVATEVGAWSATFDRERKYTGISVRQDPGAIWMWIGSALLVIGMTVTFTCRHRRVWLRVTDEDGCRVRLGSSDKQDLGFERTFTALTQDLQTALDAEPATTEGENHDR